jgi:hypothetical protein
LENSYQKTNDSLFESYKLFLYKLLQPDAIEILKSLQQFVSKFQSYSLDIVQDSNKGFYDKFLSAPSTASSITFPPNPSGRREQEDSMVIWRFLEGTHQQMRDSKGWSSETAAEFEASKLSCEKLVFSKLHKALFSPEEGWATEGSMDERTKERIRSLAFITAEHLDLRSIQHLAAASASSSVDAWMEGCNFEASSKQGQLEAALLRGPIESLRMLQWCSCPSDKLLCIKRCSIFISQLLNSVGSCTYGKIASDGISTVGNVGSKGPPGADELLPVMILAIKYCNPEAIHSNIRYLQRYLRPERLVSEAGYLLTNLVSAVFFLDGVDAQALTIDPEEFERSLRRCKEMARQSDLKRLRQLQRRNKNNNIFFSFFGEREANASDNDEDEVDIDCLYQKYLYEKDSYLSKQFINIHKT